jgi:acetylglutamate kinase
MVVVHGGGPEINELLDRLGKKSVFIDGLRQTDEETMDVVQMVLSGRVNKQLVAMIEKSGGKALGLCGIDGGMLRAVKHESKSGDLGYVGDVSSVDSVPIVSALREGYIPVVATVALGELDGKPYNVNADTAAAAIAVSLKAEKFVLLTDVPGVLRDPERPETLIKTLHRTDIPELRAQGIIQGGMIPKIECCVAAVSGGVSKAHIIDGRVPHSILLEVFLDQGIGTMLS